MNQTARAIEMSNVVPLKVDGDRQAKWGETRALALPPSMLAPRLLLIAQAADRDRLELDLYRGLPHAAVTFAAGHAAAVETVASRRDFDLVIVELGMRGYDDADAVSETMSKGDHPPVVLLYRDCRADEARSLLRAGAAALMPQSSSGMSLLGVVYLVLNGQRFTPPELLMPVGQGDAGPHSADFADLSGRQRQVARLLIQGQSNKEIARRLDLQEITIKVYVSSIFRKLNVRNRTEAATRLLNHWSG